MARGCQADVIQRNTANNVNLPKVVSEPRFNVVVSLVVEQHHFTRFEIDRLEFLRLWLGEMLSAVGDLYELLSDSLELARF